MTFLKRIGFVLLVFAATVVVVADEVPLVVAVDTSRSLRKADIEAVHDVLAREFEAIAADVPIGLVVFDDTARWLASPGAPRTEVLAALMAVEPAGSFTVLYDALFLAARELDEGGVILAISDGRDENSAVTVRDVEGLCSRNGVRLVTSGIGRRIDDRALRRLALLTRGPYLGTFGDIMPAELAAQVTKAAAEVLVARPAVSPPATPEPAVEIVAPTLAPTAMSVTSAEGASNGVLFASVLLFLSLGVLGIGGWWFFRRAFPASILCEICGGAIEGGGGGCPVCEVEAVRQAARDGAVAAADVTRMPELDPAALRLETLPGGIDRTMALGDLAMLTVREEGQPERAFAMPKNHILAVGRAPGVNTVQVEDVTVSAQHFKIAYKDDAYHVVDLGTTNGTMINQEKIEVRRLVPGDVIRAGLTDFLFDSFDPAAGE